MAQITEKIIEIKAKVEGATTVKELKEQIAELTNMMDTLDKESQDYTDTVNLLVDAEEQLTNAMKVGKSQLSAQEGSYNALVNRMAALKKAHKAVTDETTRNRLSEEINNINNQLKEMDANNGVFVRNVGNYENAFKEALKTPQQELKALRTQLAQLTEGTDEYNAVFTRMAQLTHDVTEQQEMLKWSSADLGDILGNLSGVATSIAGGFSAFNALGSLVGGESEEFEEAMLQAQRFIQLIQGLEQVEQLSDKIKGLWKGINNYVASQREANETVEVFSDELTDTIQAQTVSTTATATNTSATRANTVATNAQSTANVVATTTTGLFSKALGVLKVALISTGIGAIVVALGYLVTLLGNGIGKVWDWISGANKAKEQTQRLQESLNALNESLSVQEKAWERQEKLMQAQGKSYEEIYQARKKNLQAQLAETQALLASQQAIAKDIGEKKLQKDKYEEFRKSLEELIEKEKQLKETIDNLDYDKYINDIENETKAENERTEALKKAAEEAQEAHKKEKESAENLYKELAEHYKDDKLKLKEKYNEQKKLLEKYGKDTTTLTKKFEQEITDIEIKEEEARRKLREQFQKDFDASFRYPSLEYFQNQLDKATKKYEDFNNVASRLSEDNFDENIEKLGKEYGVTIQSMEHFDVIFKKVLIDLEDAKKALKEYQSGERVKEIEKEIDAINTLMEIETEEKQVEYDLYASQSNLYNGMINNEISQMYERWKTEDAIFNLRKERLNEEIELYKKAAEDEKLTAEEKNIALEKASKLERQLQLETADHTIAQNTRKSESIEKYVETVKSSLDGVSSILDNVASAWETNIQTEIETGKISEEEGEKRMEEMKDIQSAIALINTFSSAVSAYQSLASIPLIGPALGAAASAAAIASGLAQVKAIQAVKKGDNGGDNTRYAEVQPQIPNDYNPTPVTNVTSAQETETLANALSKTPIWVAVKDIDNAQSKVDTRDKETTF